ncbi:MAG TPA: Wzt carbohydrate-binding domain-containing protein, partial [Phycisphaerae bacterium]|nr:Wzt carbohydrate-binding domain-containing protein [Phycisphaerae bacterium]
LDRDLGRFRAGEVVDVTFDFPLDLGPGDYSATVAVHLDESHLVTSFDWVDKACRFRVMPSTDFRFYGMARLCPKVRVSEPRPSDIDIPATLVALFGQPPGRLDSGCECDPWFLDGWIVADGVPEAGRVREADAVREDEAKKGRGAERVRDRLRRLDGKGRFLFQPTATRMAVETTARAGSALPHDEVIGGSRQTADRKGADAGTDRVRLGLQLAWLGGSVAGEPGESGLFTFPLPADLIGRLQVFSLTRTGSAVAAPEKPGPPPSGPGIRSIYSFPEQMP